MTDLSEVGVGDKVSVTMTGIVTHDNSDHLEFVDESGDDYYFGSWVFTRAGTELTIVEKGVEVFGPGSVVKHIASGSVYTVLEDNKYFSHSRKVKSMASFPFTSEHYERLA